MLPDIFRVMRSVFSFFSDRQKSYFFENLLEHDFLCSFLYGMPTNMYTLSSMVAIDPLIFIIYWFRLFIFARFLKAMCKNLFSSCIETFLWYIEHRNVSHIPFCWVFMAYAVVKFKFAFSFFIQILMSIIPLIKYICLIERLVTLWSLTA